MVNSLKKYVLAAVQVEAALLLFEVIRFEYIITMPAHLNS